jgi:hypothetical protein
MRGLGRPCRGQGRLFVTVVRHTAQQLLALGQPLHARGPPAQQRLAQADDRNEAQREG